MHAERLIERLACPFIGDRGLVHLRRQLEHEDELLAAIDGDEEAALRAVDGPILPGARERDEIVERRRSEPDRQHPPAHIIARNAGLAAEDVAELLADGAARAIGSDEIVAGKAPRLVIR